MNKITALSLFLVSTLGLASNASSTTYDFNSLSLGALNGQDNWVAIGIGSNIQPPQVFSGSHDGTQYISRGGGGTGNTRGTGTRVNDGSFAFSLIGGTLLIDMRLNHWGNSFGTGFDADSSGVLDVGERTLVFAVGNVPGLNLNGTSTSANAIGMGSGDWVRFRIDFDFDANGGNGSANVSAKNITDGDVVFNAIAGLQGVNLGLPTSGNQTHDNWNAMWFSFEADTNASIDNITFNSVSVGPPVSVPLLPPTALIPLALGLMWFGRRRLATRHKVH